MEEKEKEATDAALGDGQDALQALVRVQVSKWHALKGTYTRTLAVFKDRIDTLDPKVRQLCVCVLIRTVYLSHTLFSRFPHPRPAPLPSRSRTK